MSYTIRHGQFVIAEYAFKVGTKSELIQANFESDKDQGFGVPAKALTIINHGGGTNGHYLHIQHSEDHHSWCHEFRIYDGERFFIRPEHGIWIAEAKVWADSIGTVCSIHAAPGIWSDFELAELNKVQGQIQARIAAIASQGFYKTPVTPSQAGQVTL
jgi:hypothetical protein